MPMGRSYINGKIVTRSLKNVFTALVLCILFLSVRGASADRSNAPLQAVTPFLYPPYPGTASQESIFDHSTPNYTYDNKIVAFTGDQANKNCPVPAPPGTPPPQAGVCNAGAGGYWSYSLGDWVCMLQPMQTRSCTRAGGTLRITRSISAFMFACIIQMDTTHTTDI